MKGHALVKDFKIGCAIGDDITFEDFYALKEFKSGSYKVSAVEIASDGHSGYITGLRFTYSSILDPFKSIQGCIMGSENVFEKNNTKHKKQLFKLENDEFLIEFVGRKGMILDRFGFRTNHGKTYEFGGNGGGPYSLPAPTGFHFVNFGSLFSKGWGNISAFSSDIASIPTKDQLISNSNQDNSTNKVIQELIKRPVFRHLISFLTVKEVSQLFQTCKIVSNIRHDNFIQTSLYLRCLFSGSENLLQYGEILVKGTKANSENTSDQLIANYRKKCQNLIKSDDEIKVQSPSSFQTKKQQDGIKYFEVSQQNRIKFEWKCSLEDTSSNFSTEELIALTEGKLGIVAGVQISDSGYATEAWLDLQLKYDNEAIILIQMKLNLKTRDFQTSNLTYCRRVTKDNNESGSKEQLLIPKSILFTLTVYEPSWWPARIKKFHLRKIPLDNDTEIQCAKQFSSSQSLMDVQQINCRSQNMLMK